jgi:ATP-dependent protease HslVU (ClpYQ) peptidase subunit
MSVIAVKIENGVIHISGDSQTTWGSNKFPKENYSDKHVKACGKIFQVNIGLLQIFCKTHAPNEMERDDILNWLIEFKEWANAKAKIGFNDISIHGIMIRDKRVFCFYDFMDVVEVRQFDAVGSGMWLAIGAMEAGKSSKEAVDIAKKYDLYCGGEITEIIIE